MAAKRYTHTATLLLNGKVLAAGGSTDIIDNPFLSSAEVFDPATGLWTSTGSMGTARRAHTATRLPDGTVLVAGGAVDNTGTGSLSSAELYDPATGLWTATGSMGDARSWHTASLLLNGTVLVAGGTGNAGVLSSAELYDPATGLWTPAASMGEARHFTYATLLPDGKVLVAGGGTIADGSVTLSSAEVYDPITGLWTATGSMATARQGARPTLLVNGKVLVAGGWGGAASGSLSSAELYDPATGLWTPTGSTKAVRYRSTATLLPDGKVLVAGGETGVGAAFDNSAELYDPATGAWSTTVSMKTARATHTATLLSDSKVLVAGGTGGSGTIFSAERFDSTPPEKQHAWEYKQGFEFFTDTLGCAVVRPGRKEHGIGGIANILILMIPAIVLFAGRRR
jgi:WD40 repeat protein